MACFYLTHPQVDVRPDIAVPQWSLSDRGRARLAALAAKRWPAQVAHIVSSDETKAIETAIAVGEITSLAHEVLPGMHENDRSSTGFLQPDRFEAAADWFFAHPDESFQGWERAIDAQARIVAAVRAIAAERRGAILFTGHGAVGTLLKCHLKGLPISRNEDQPPGGGNIFAFDVGAGACFSDWTPLEDFEWPWETGT